VVLGVLGILQLALGGEELGALLFVSINEKDLLPARGSQHRQVTSNGALARSALASAYGNNHVASFSVVI
jgi:hypothetical protein